MRKDTKMDAHVTKVDIDTTLQLKKNQKSPNLKGRSGKKAYVG